MSYVNPATDLKRLKFISLHGNFQRLQSIAQEISEKYSNPIPSTNAGKWEMPFRMADRTAMSLFSEGALEEAIRPIKTTGDGNCLFHAASKAICQTEVLSTELRLRTGLELILNPDFYGAHPVITSFDTTTRSGSPWIKEGLYDAIIFSNDSSKALAKNGFESGLHHEIYNTLYDGRFSGLLQIMGLASASGCKIKLEYPDARHSLFSLLSSVYSPRVGSSRPRRFSIMWTDTAGWPDRSKEFKVNHFVPMMKVNLQDNWVTVTRKGRTGKRPINDEKKKRSPTSHNKTGSFEPKSPPTKSGRFDYFQSDNHSSKKKNSSATNTRQHTSRTSSNFKASWNLNRPSKSPVEPKKISPSSDRKKCTGSWTSSSAKIQNDVPSSSNVFENESPVRSSPQDHTDSLNEDRDRKKSCFSKRANSSATNTQRDNNTSQKKRDEPSPDPDKSRTSSENAQKISPSSIRKQSNSCDASAENKFDASSSPLEFGNESPVESSTHVCDRSNKGVDTKLEPSPVKKQSDSEDEGVGNVSAARSPIESGVNLPEASKTEKVDVDFENSFALPLSAASRSFYAKRGKLCQKNLKRSTNRQDDARTSVEGQQIVDQVRRGTVKGTLKENIACLEEKIRSNSDSQHLASQLGTLAVANHILKHGPLVATTELCDVYKKASGNSSDRRMMSAELFSIASKHLNIIQFYIQGQAFISENTESDFESIISFIQNQVNSRKHLNEHVTSTIGDSFKEGLNYMDSKRDRDTVTALMERLTSVKLVAGKLLNVQNKRAVQGCRDSFKENLRTFRDIKKTSQVVRNDMTNEQQRRLALRIANKRKVKEILHVAPGRGRKLKCEENPMLVPLLEYAFMEADVIAGGGGVQSHPRLIDDTLYRTADNVTNMKQARELVLAMSNPDFNISLSCCYNYTQNYKKNTLQAKRHHDGRQINAKISFHNPPRVGVEKQVVNIHWSSANVNFIVDECEANKNSYMIDSKDAKSIVPGDIAPVQKPMKTWKQRSGILPDHDWEQGRANAITPMAHLLMESKILSSSEEVTIPLSSNSVSVSVTRTGKAVYLTYLSYYEPETVLRCLNEVLFIMVQPSLDVFFRNPETGKLKENFVFISDNGPAEQPSSPAVQMCLARLFNFLNLDKVIQVSFAEYHSKRNFVERVHPQANKALSAHGAFSSHEKHADVKGPGTPEHRENMEQMASAVNQCLQGASFGGKYIDVYRGPREDQWIFDDDTELKTFLSMAEYGKEVSGMTYKARNTSLLQSLHDVWDINVNFEREYWDDHKVVKGEESIRSSWCDKYTTVIFRNRDDCRGPPQEPMHRQPLADYMRWLETGGELHYLQHDARKSLTTGRWDTIQGCFLPSHCLDLAYVLLSKPTGFLLRSLALLSWVPESEVQQFYDEKSSEIQRDIQSCLNRDQWKSHKLYKEKKEALVTLCKAKNIETSGMKHELVERLALEQKEEPPIRPPMYQGQKELPRSTKEIGQLSKSYLQSVLTYNGFPACGTKDELILRVSLIANNRAHLCFNRERKMFLDLIGVTKELILAEKNHTLCNNAPTYRQRTFTTPTATSLSSDRPRYHAAVQTQTSGKACVDVPEGISKDNLHEIFNELTQRIKAETEVSISKETPNTCGEGDTASDNKDIRTAILQEGTRVKVFWNAEDVEGTGWHEGWYMAVVTTVIKEDLGTANVTYVVEPSESYEVNVEELLQKGWIRIDDGDEIEQFYEIGARIKVKWSKEEIGDSEWRPGWYVGEVQSADRDNDEITVQFVSEPECTYMYEVTPCLARGTLRMVKPVF